MISVDNKDSDKVAIVVVGYNRLRSITRLLQSLCAAQYPSQEIPLVISIDCSGNRELYKYVEDFQWPHGTKYVYIHEERLGLIGHIYQCGDLTSLFKAIILLEDDLVVSPVFYSYVLQALDMYGTDSRIAEISLYKNNSNGYVGLPFDNIQKGYDVFLMQDVCTWGQCFTLNMWSLFKKWLDLHDEEYIENIDMPSIIKNWTRAWSKYYNAYVVDTNKFVLYPNISLTTNFSDSGEHGGDNNTGVQVNLLQDDFQYRLANFDLLDKYDIYSNNLCLYDCLGLSSSETSLDIYGFRDSSSYKRYILTTRQLPFVAIKSFALNMRPIELNVVYNVSGTGLFLYDSTQYVGSSKKQKFNEAVITYFLAGFNKRLLLNYIIRYVKKTILVKITK